MEIAKVDTVTLTGVINQCFDNTADGRFSDAEQKNFMLDGKRLRGQLLTLLSAQFDKGSEPLKAANAKLSEVNDKLDDDAAVLANVSAVMGEISTLAKTLDNLLSAAIGFL